MARTRIINEQIRIPRDSVRGTYKPDTAGARRGRCVPDPPRWRSTNDFGILFSYHIAPLASPQPEDIGKSEVLLQPYFNYLY